MSQSSDLESKLTALQQAATLKERAKTKKAFSRLLNYEADLMSGADHPVLIAVQTFADVAADFYRVPRIKVFYANNELGVQWNGLTRAAFDNWIGFDPDMLQKAAAKYGTHFAENVIAHEIGHHVVDRLGFAGIPRIANEAIADYLAGIFAGSKGLDPNGFAQFLAEQPPDGKDYPHGPERHALYLAGYRTAAEYTFQNFQAVIDDPRFNLRLALCQVVERYC